MTGRASSSGLGQTHRAAPVEPQREPSSTLKEGVPPNFAKVCPVRKEDPSYPGNGVEEGEQCCSCGEFVLLDDVERNKGYVCRGLESDGRTRCFHVVCHECKGLEFPSAGLVCPCIHFGTDGKVLVEKEDGESLRKSDSTPVRQGQQNRPHTQHEGTVRSTLKSSATMGFPKGSADAPMDLDAGLREFDCVVAHLSGSRGLIPEDRIAHLLSCWGPETDPGENMRLDQQSEPYLTYERVGQMENCWQVLLARLNRYRIEPSEARRAAEALWNGLYWPGEIDAFHTLMRRAVTRMRRVHMPLPDHQLVTRYLEPIPREKAVALEDPLRRPSMGWTYGDVKVACKELFSIGAPTRAPVEVVSHMLDREPLGRMIKGWPRPLWDCWRLRSPSSSRAGKVEVREPG